MDMFAACSEINTEDVTEYVTLLRSWFRSCKENHNNNNNNNNNIK